MSKRNDQRHGADGAVSGTASVPIDVEAGLARLHSAGARPLPEPGPTPLHVREYDFLVERHLDVATLAKAAAVAQDWNVPLHRVLISESWVRDADYAEALAGRLRVPVGTWDLDMSRSMTAPWPRQDHGLPGRIGTLWVQVLSATQESPWALSEQVQALQSAGIPVVIASNACLEAALERAGRTRRLRHSIYGLLHSAPDLSARRAMARWQHLAIVIVPLAMVAGVAIAPTAAVQALLAVFCLSFLAIAVTRGLALVELYRNRPGKREEVPPIPDAELPTYSVLVPLFREISVLPDLIDAMSDLDYPTGLLDILLVIEDADLEMQAALIGMDLPGHFRVVVVPDSGPRTKPKALNYALASARGEFIVVFDAEDRPDIDQLRKAAACFRASPPEVACVQARLNIYNAQESWISRQFAIEYSALFDAILPSLERYGFPIPLGGTSNHFSRQALQDMGGWDPFNVTEDADLGIRLARRGRTTLILESTTWEEAPVFLKQWFRQRTRWLKGWMQTWLVHMRRPVRLISDLGAWQFAGLQIVMGGILLSALVHPFFYVFSATEALGLRMPLPDGAIGNGLLWAGWITLVLGFGAAALVGMIAAHRRRQSLTWSFMLLPAYWLLISAAAYRALWQLWRDPYYWEKTPHGVSKRRSPRPPQRRSQRAR